MDRESEVLAAAAAIVDAFGAHDRDRYFSLFDPTATFIFHTTPFRLEDRAAYEREWDSWVRDMGFHVQSCSSDNQRVQLFGDLAVFTHDVTTMLSTNDGSDTTHERETIVFEYRNGTWIAVHEHLSPAQFD